MNTDYYVNLTSENELRIEQKVLFNYYMEFLNISSTKNVYSCNIKQDNWDTRIVNLDDLTLYRFSNPSFTKDIQKLNEIRKCFSILQENNLAKVSATGVCEEQFWYQRKLFPSNALLSSIFESEHNINVYLDMLIDVLNCTKLLWDNNVYHGNICEDNIVLDGSKFILIDPIFSFVSQNGRMPTIKDDTQNLEKLIKEVIRRKNCASLEAVISALEQGNISLLIAKINELKKTLYAPLSSGVIIKKPQKLQSDEVNLKANNIENPFLNSNENGAKGGVNNAGNNGNLGANNNYNNNYHQKNGSSSTSSKFIMYCLILILLGIIGYFNRDRIKNFSFNRGNEKLLEYEYSWNTNQPVFMKEVLKEALGGDVYAQSVIVNAAFDPKRTSSYLDSYIIKSIFNPLWENELSEEDRKMAFRLGLPKLVSPEEKNAPALPFIELHPAIAMTVAGRVELDKTFDQLEEIPLDFLTTLGGIYGESFSKLKILGVKSLAQLTSKSLSSIFVMGGNRENIAGFFADSAAEPALLRGKLLILFELSKKGFLSLDAIYDIVNKYFKKPLSLFFDFFNTNDWKGVDKLDVLNFVAGKFPDKQFGVLQYIDLLSYPSKEVRKTAASFLKSNKKLNEKMLDFIAEGNSNLTREQVYILMSLFLINGDKQHAVIEKFIATNPNVNTALKLLLFRDKESKDDIFNLEISRYLSHKELKLTKDIIWKLAVHPEPMARAIGYSNFDLNDKKDRAYLEKMRNEESSNLLKVLIAKRLE